MVARYTSTSTRSGAGIAARIVLTLLGAAGMIVSALLEWWNGLVGTDLTDKVLYQTTFTRADRFLTSIGAVMIALGIVAVLGLVDSTGWLIRLAGALGIVAFILVAIQGYRSTASVSTELDQTDVGAWVALAGGLVALVGGFLGRPQVVVASARVRDDVDDV
jgi:peptidoglycan/LPS O-acetylase OafA/YrhL